MDATMTKRWWWRWFYAPLQFVGEISIILWEGVRGIFKRPMEWAEMLNQMLFVGLGSVPIVVLTTFASGAVMALYISPLLIRMGGDSMVGGTVGLTVSRELGPVVAGIMVAARCGSAMAAQIGSMAVTEQIDALRALGVQPVEYLVVPRTVAMLISMPILVAECAALSVAASYFVGTQVLDISEAYFMKSMVRYTGAGDIQMALIKGFFFAVVIVFVSCHQGLNAREGAVGVGRAPTEAVVISSLGILVLNFFLSFALNIFYPAG